MKRKNSYNSRRLHEDDSHIDNDYYDYIDDDYLTDEDYERSAEIIKAFRKGYRDGFEASKQEAINYNKESDEDYENYEYDEDDEYDENQIYPTKPNTLIRKIIKQQPNYVGLFNKPHDNYPEYVIDTNMTDWCDRIKKSITSTEGIILRLVRFTPAGFDTDYEGLLTIQDQNGNTEQYYVKFK